ncbi:MAG: ABC transporter permease subunit [Actinobacteria bacterium]|nr:MAG: ABC transporter permease subunit [Actinomycetota bacterium]
MEVLFTGLKQSISLFKSDPDLWQIVFATLTITGTATLLSLLLGMPAGIFLGLVDFKGKKAILSVVNTGMGLPPVVVGLVVSLLLWRSGILGFLNIMYTPLAIVIAEFIIACPIVVGLTFAAIQNLDPSLREQVLSLGASRYQFVRTVIKEARIPTLAAIIAGYGSIISEVGATIMVGGNIKGQTRVLTTAILLETQAGNFEKAIALSTILLVLAISLNVAFTKVQQKGARNWQKVYR